MARTVRCLNCDGFARLAFDGYFSCDDCNTHMTGESFKHWLVEIEEKLVRRRMLIRELRESPELQ